MRTSLFAHARPEEVLEARRSTGVLWLPLGPLEWHGPHLPFGVDALIAEATAIACSARLGGLVLPTLYSGTERERSPQTLADLGLAPEAFVVGMDFPGNSIKSGYFPEEEFALQVRGWIERALAWEFPTLVIINGHGAQNHNSTLKRFVEAYRSSAWPIDVLAFMALSQQAGDTLNVGHASADETSLIMLDHPGDVALDRLPISNQPLKSADFAIVDDLTFRGQPTPDRTLRTEDDPRFNATLCRGRSVREKTVDSVCQSVGDFLQDRHNAVRTNVVCHL